MRWTSCALHLLVVRPGNILSAHDRDNLSRIIFAHHRQFPHVERGHETQCRIQGVVHRYGRHPSHGDILGQEKAVHFLVRHGLTQVGHGDDPGQILLPVDNREILLVGAEA